MGTAMALLISGIIAAVAGTAGAGISAGVAAKNNKQNLLAQADANRTNLQINRENNQANKELAELAYQQNLSQWRMENEYNSPANQMARFEAAGLNKNLIYSQSNTSASSPTMSYTPMQAGKVSPVLGQVDTSSISQMFTALSSLGQVMLNYQAMKNSEQEMKFKSELFPFQLQSVKAAAAKDIVSADYAKKSMEADLTYKGFQSKLIEQQINKIKDDLLTSGLSRTEIAKKVDLLQQEIDAAKFRNSLPYQDLQLKRMYLDNQALSDRHSLSALDLFAKKREYVPTWQENRDLFNYRKDMLIFDKDLKEWEHDALNTMSPKARRMGYRAKHLNPFVGIGRGLMSLVK